MDRRNFLRLLNLGLIAGGAFSLLPRRKYWPGGLGEPRMMAIKIPQGMIIDPITIPFKLFNRLEGPATYPAQYLGEFVK